MKTVKIIVASFVSALLIFQLFHFAEHFIQLWEWFRGFRNMPYMTPWATELVWMLGERIAPGEEDYHRVFRLGVESLHLIGNTLFLIGIIGLQIFIRNKYTKWAFWIQVIHLFEHIMLFCTAYYLHQPIGMSTLFGYFQPYGTDIYDRVALTNFRVWWHFIANLIPTVLIFLALPCPFKKKKNAL